jgi:hypothetical protein
MLQEPDVKRGVRMMLPATLVWTVNDSSALPP